MLTDWIFVVRLAVEHAMFAASQTDAALPTTVVREDKSKKITQNARGARPLTPKTVPSDAAVQPPTVLVALLLYLSTLMTLIEGYSIGAADVAALLRQQGFEFGSPSMHTRRPRGRDPP